jgi:hypothetical protein
VERIPPVFVTMESRAREVARRTCGEELLATQAASVGEEQFIPEIVRKRLPYRTVLSYDPDIESSVHSSQHGKNIQQTEEHGESDRTAKSRKNRDEPSTVISICYERSDIGDLCEMSKS